MADFPTFEKNVNRPTRPVTLSTPAFDGNNTAKTVEQKRVEQQWRDAHWPLMLDRQFPLALNRDATTIVTSDPYQED